MHDWVDANFMGTKGWYRCQRCGVRTTNTACLSSCDEEVEYKVARLKKKIDSLLHKEDADTATIRQKLGLVDTIR